MSKKKELGIPIHVRLYPETEDLLRRKAKEEARTVSGMIRWIIMTWLHERSRGK